MNVMSKATESKLSALHGAVADVLTAQITHQEDDVSYDADGNEISTGGKVYVASPATIAVAVKFLKDNSITCDIEQNKNLESLRDVLANKQRRSRMGDPLDEANKH